HSADRVFVQTTIERNALLQLGLPDVRIVLQGLGVDVAECSRGERDQARARWGIAPNDVAIGHLANNSVEKGTVDLLNAAQRLWQTNVPFTLVLAGPEMPNFQRFWRAFAPA